MGVAGLGLQGNGVPDALTYSLGLDQKFFVAPLLLLGPGVSLFILLHGGLEKRYFVHVHD